MSGLAIVSGTFVNKAVDFVKDPETHKKVKSGFKSVVNEAGNLACKAYDGIDEFGGKLKK